MNKKKLAWGGYLVAVHLALAAAAVLAWKVYFEEHPAWPLMRELHAEMDPHVPAGTVIFLGDSITQGLATEAVTPVSVNYGISGQTSKQLLEGMGAYHSLSRAAAVVVMIGTNDLRMGEAAGIDQRYRAILARIPAGVPVVLASVPPMAGVDVAPAVSAARAACASDPRCNFVDVSQLPADSLRRDGVHLSDAGYDRLIELLRAGLDRAGQRVLQMPTMAKASRPSGT